MDTKTVIKETVHSYITGFIIGSFIILYVAVVIPQIMRYVAQNKQQHGPNYVLTMVKNEAAIGLPRLLKSINDITVIVCDTGSTDDTIAWLETMPRVIIFQSQMGWKNFADNRNECLQFLSSLAFDHDDYVLLMDADHEMVVNGKSYPIVYDVNTIQIQSIRPERPRNAGSLLIRANVLTRCVYRLPTHEYLDCTGPNTTFGRYDYISLLHHHDGNTSSIKFERDREILEDWLHNSSNPHQARALFYLAETYVALGLVDKAMETYRNHIAIETLTNYVFQSKYSYAKLSLSGDAFLDAIDAHDGNTRWEPLYYLARLARAAGQFNRCIMYTSAALSAPRIDYARKPLFIEPAIYDWALEEERAFCLYRAGKTSESKELYHELATRPVVKQNAEAYKRISIKV